MRIRQSKVYHFLFFEQGILGSFGTVFRFRNSAQCPEFYYILG